MKKRKKIPEKPLTPAQPEDTVEPKKPTVKSDSDNVETTKKKATPNNFEEEEELDERELGGEA